MNLFALVVQLTILAKQRTFYERFVKHGCFDKNNSINQYLNECGGLKHIMDLISINILLLNDNIHDEPLLNHPK